MKKFKADGKPVRVWVAIDGEMGIWIKPLDGTVALFKSCANSYSRLSVHRATLTIDAPKPAKKGKVKHV